MSGHGHHRALGRPRRSIGASLVIVLVSLVVLTSAATTLMRLVDIGSLIAGNLAYKQATTSATDIGAQAAFDWLVARQASTTLENDSAENGYYANAIAELDVTDTEL